MDTLNLRVTAISILAGMTFALVGCTGNPGGPELAPVSGTVKYKGQPLPNAMVVFHPQGEGSFSASGMTDASGAYSLMAPPHGLGAKPGKFSITVEARGPDKPPAGQTAVVPGGPSIQGDLLIPAKYTKPDTSGLEAEVKSGKNTFDFDLKD